MTTYDSNLIVWDALAAWKDNLFRKNMFRRSRMVSLCNMSKIIEKGLLDPEQPLTLFLSTDLAEKRKQIESLPDWSDATKQHRRSLFNSFYKFVNITEIKQANTIIPFKEYRCLKKAAIDELLSPNELKSKSQSLTAAQLERFFTELRNANERDFLVCWTVWNLKCTIHEALNLKVGSYNLHTGVFKISENDFRLGYIRPELKDLILKQCEGKAQDGLLFPTDKGRSIHPGHMVKTMKAASKRAKLPFPLSPSVLYAHAVAYSKAQFDMMSAEEIEKLSSLYSKQYGKICENPKKRLLDKIK